MARIFVKSGRDDDRVALWERHPDHLGGDALIFHERDRKGTLVERAYEVERTERIATALREGALIEVSKDEAETIEQEAAAHIQSMLTEEA